MKLKLIPYNLVRVQEDGYAFIGEIISREIGDGTIMVRRVPGDPNTMEQMSIEKLAPPSVKYKYVHYAAVNGRCGFPVDMLRYDFAAPVNFRIEKNDYQDKVILNEGETELIIAKVTDRKSPNWTPARWSSFVWGLSELKTLLIIKGQ